jgi:hypothetical protein
LKDAVIACKAETNGVCGKILPGQGRITACVLSNESTASAGCTEAIQKIESMAAHEGDPALDLAVTSAVAIMRPIPAKLTATCISMAL